MAGFLTPLSVTPLPDGRYWQINRDLEYCVGAPDSLEKVFIPCGFKTDFASTPRILWPIFPPMGKYTAAAVVHDFLYRYPQRKEYLTEEFGVYLASAYNRGDCDNIFREAMEVLSVSRMTRWMMWSGVRTGGWVTWRKYRKEDAANG